MSSIRAPSAGEIDTTYQTVQRDMFTSGLAAQIGANAFGVWSAIKAHADFETGRAWPGTRKLAEMTGIGQSTVMRAIAALEEAHLLRKAKVGWPGKPGRGRTHTYIARERMDVRFGRRVICTIVVDYVPLQMRAQLQAIKDSHGDPSSLPDELWAQVDVLPGDGLAWDETRKVLTSRIDPRDVPLQTLERAIPGQEARAKVIAIADQMRARAKVPKK